jgi:hypothetical protein
MGEINLGKKVHKYLHIGQRTIYVIKFSQYLATRKHEAKAQMQYVRAIEQSLTGRYLFQVHTTRHLQKLLMPPRIATR